MRGIHVWATVSALSLAAGLATPAFAQDSGDIIVTARRSEERLQDVPVSISVVSQAQLSDRNITSAAELAQYVPSLSTDQRYGGDATTFNIRGFYQEASSSPTVGVYFADAIAPRGNNLTNTPSGDGVGAGNLFDLQNVQVLKGPQGTLFGRNTTGGVILLVPTKPTSRLEGYVEGSVGNYGLDREQAVLNIPLSDIARLRLGFDRQQRDGYQHNISGIGPDRFGTSNYYALRASLVVDLTPNLENYTIATYAKSNTRPPLNSLVACDPETPTAGAPAQMIQYLGLCNAYQQRRAAGGFYSVQNSTNGPTTQKNEQWQLINTTTWHASDTLTLKNIAAYAQFKADFRGSIFGENYIFDPATVPATINGSAALADQYRAFATKYAGARYYIAQTSYGTAGPSASQSTFSEELQLQGHTGQLTWQGGLYVEMSNPIEHSSSAGVSNTGCIDTSFNPLCADVSKDFILNAFNLPPAFAGLVPAQGGVTTSIADIKYRNLGAYAQGTYKFSDQFAATAGIRYSKDTTKAEAGIYALRGFPIDGTFTGPNPTPICNYTGQLPANNCVTSSKATSQKPTWLIDLEYTPSRDALFYAKYTRGYRQGGLQPRSPTPSFGPEQIDAYELGSKLSYHGGGISGYMNLAGFYNVLKNQQLQASYGLNNSFYQSLLNIGKSRVWGVEADAGLRAGAFGLDASGAWLDTKIVKAPDQAALLALIAARVPAGTAVALQTFPLKGTPLPLAPKWRVSLTPSVNIPIPEDLGKMTLSGTMVYTSQSYATSADGYDGPNSKQNYNEATTLFNANLTWKGIAGTPIDLSGFITNLTNKHYYAVFLGGWGPSIGSETGRQGMPRMYGMRLRYNFGG